MFAAVCFCCYSYPLKEAGRVLLNCGDTKILECKEHRFFSWKLSQQGEKASGLFHG